MALIYVYKKRRGERGETEQSQTFLLQKTACLGHRGIYEAHVLVEVTWNQFKESFANLLNSSIEYGSLKGIQFIYVSDLSGSWETHLKGLVLAELNWNYGKRDAGAAPCYISPCQVS